MDARLQNRFFGVILFGITLFVFVSFSYSFQAESTNFTVDGAQTPEQARKFCNAAEKYRHELAILWLGKELPNWSEKYPITTRVGNNLGAGGATTFVFHENYVHGEMNIQGSEQRIIDSVLPHEISHTIFANHFQTPVPRWLDEGAATCVEHHSEKENYRNMIRYFLQKDVQKCLPFNRMVALKEYPDDVMPFYAQGYSVSEYLITIGGYKLLIKFAETAIQTNDWNYALQKHYGIPNLGELQKNYWLEWVAIGSPVLLSQIPERLRMPSSKNINPIESAANNNTSDNLTLNANNAKLSNRIPPPTPFILSSYTIKQNKTNSTVTKIPTSYAESKNSVIPIPTSYKSSYEILSAGGEPNLTTRSF
ncbi:MAG: hypothetical protein LBB88_05000 [Planctomycetaceae bacterium]|jgi:hypothetical protein|nr:hypothetical protein [Planctomycetaceae bacterium]